MLRKLFILLTGVVLASTLSLYAFGQTVVPSIMWQKPVNFAKNWLAGWGLVPEGTGTVTSPNIPTALAGGFDTTAWSAVATGTLHTCAIRSSDSRIYCWGNNENGRLGDNVAGTERSVPTALGGGFDTTAWSAVSAGGGFTCAIRSSDSYLFCWGYNGSGQLGDGTTTDRSVPTALSSTGGWNTTAWSAVAMGDSTTCAIRSSDSQIFCWGLGTSGQLGSGSSSSSSTPVGLGGGFSTTAWSKLSVGASHSCAIRSSDSRMYCWGNNANGRLGDGTTTDRNSPTALNSTGGWNTTAWSNMAAGNHTCAIRSSDSLVYCWGYNVLAALGDGTTTGRTSPTALSSTGGWNTTTWTKISAGYYHTCAIRSSDSYIFCWGDNTYNQIGDGTSTRQSTPTALNSSGGWNTTAWSQISNGQFHTCAIRSSDSQIFCWGNNSNSQIGNNTNTRTRTQIWLPTSGGWYNTQWSSVASGTTLSCAIRSSDSRIFCWGEGYSGALGSGSQTGQNIPTALTSTGSWDVTAWSQISALNTHVCAIQTSDSTIYCWGNNAGGKLGDGTTAAKTVPTALGGGFSATAWSSVSAGQNGTCAIRSSDSRIFCWGVNTYGQLGDGTLVNKNVPTALSSTGGWDVTAWSAVSTGGSHTCAIRSSDSQIFCWGNGGVGRLGTGSSTDSSTPVALGGGFSGTAWSALFVGFGQTCAIRSSDSYLFCWGYNGNGELGDGTTTNRTSPTALSSTGGWNTTSWSAVSIGVRANTCAIRSTDQRIFCWGYNYNGAVGDNSTTTRTSPTELFGNTFGYQKLSVGSEHVYAIVKSTD